METQNKESDLTLVGEGCFRTDKNVTAIEIDKMNTIQIKQKCVLNYLKIITFTSLCLFLQRQRKPPYLK